MADIINLGVNNLLDIPLMLRRLASDIENQVYGKINLVHIIVDAEKDMYTFGFGPNAGLIRELVYVLEQSKLDIMASSTE